MFYLDYINLEESEESFFKKVKLCRKRISTSLIGDINSYYGTNVDLLSLKMKIDIFKLDKKTINKLDKIINIILEKDVLISNNVIKNKNVYEYLIRYFKFKGINIINNEYSDSYWKLHEIMILDLLNDITKYIDFPKSKLRIGILIKSINQDFYYYLEKIGQEYKEVVIMTKTEIRLESIINKLYEEYGIIITLNNKSLFLKSDIIINYGLNNDEKFIIGKSIVLNVGKKEDDNLKLLDGIIINNFNFDFCKFDFNDNEYKNYFEKLKNFDKKMVYQSIIMKNTSYINILNRIKQDGVEIKEYVGTNGVIQVSEFSRYGSFLKNSKYMSAIRKK